MADGLNPHQRRAVKTLAGPLLVLAGAGSGKTRVITYRIAELIRSGIKAERILAVTFTNKAANEMRHRAAQLLKKRKRRVESPEISTFHSLCVRILRRHIDKLGYPKQFPIYDAGDQESVARKVLREIRVGHEKLKPSDLMHQIGSWKSAGLRPEGAERVATSDRELLSALAYNKYQQALKACGAVDFDDILLCTEELFSKFPEVRFAESSRFDHLLIDEYQDTNALQYRIVKTLADRHRNLCVVGDDDQSIYGWRGAEVSHILNFSKDWPDAAVVRLEDNYRSRESILTLANTLIAVNTQRHPKVLRAARKGGAPPRVCRFDDEATEAEAIVREIVQLTQTESSEGASPSDIAILFRTNEQPRVFETELRRNNVPYVMVGGQSFYDRKEIRDLMAYLKVLNHPEDEVSLLRVINTPPRGIGSGSVQALVKLAVSEGTPLWQILPEAERNAEISHAVSLRVTDFVEQISALRAKAKNTGLVDVTRDMIQTLGYRRELERTYKNPTDVEARWAAVEELVNAIGIYEERSAKPSLAGFLEEIALSGREDLRDDKDPRTEKAVTLMTLHSAKGLEFPRVYMVGMEEGLLPHQRSLLDGGNSIAEERRLAYVGVTRAKDYLTLSLAKQRMKWGKARPSIVSRFLLEMRGETEKAQRAALAAEQSLKPAAAMLGKASTKSDAGHSEAAASRGADRATARQAVAKRPSPASASDKAAAPKKKGVSRSATDANRKAKADPNRSRKVDPNRSRRAAGSRRRG